MTIPNQAQPQPASVERPNEIKFKTRLGAVEFGTLENGGIYVEIDGRQNRRLSKENEAELIAWLKATPPLSADEREELSVTRENAELKQQRAKIKDAFDAVWAVCVECGMEVHPPDEDSEGQEWSHQLGFIRELKQRVEELEADRRDTERVSHSTANISALVDAGVDRLNREYAELKQRAEAAEARLERPE